MILFFFSGIHNICHVCYLMDVMFVCVSFICINNEFCYFSIAFINIKWCCFFLKFSSIFVVCFLNSMKFYHLWDLICSGNCLCANKLRYFENNWFLIFQFQFHQIFTMHIIHQVHVIYFRIVIYYRSVHSGPPELCFRGKKNLIVF